MSNDLTNSPLERQNVLNNSYAISNAQQHLNLGGVEFNDDVFFTKQQVMSIYNVADSTIERYLQQHGV